MKMYKFGLKLWSINDNYIKEAIRLHEQGIYDYIELYAIPETYSSHINLWKALGIPFVIHAPHFSDGLNLAKKESRDNNLRLISETRKFADALKADKIIVHPGIAGKIEETIRQLKEINDPRFLIENKPYYALNNGLICNGASFKEIKAILKNAGTGFCLDIGHAFCAARGLNEEPMDFLEKFLRLTPEMFHLTDGDYSSKHDRHDHFGRGNYDLKSIVEIIPGEAMVTIETVKDSKNNLNDFKQDVKFIRKLDRSFPKLMKQ